MKKNDEHKILIMHFDRKQKRFIDKTKTIQWYREEEKSLRVKFYGTDKLYHISYNNMVIYKQPKTLNLDDETYIAGHRLEDYNKVLLFDKWVKVFFMDGTTRVERASEIKTFSSLKSKGPNNVLRFNYYKELARESKQYGDEFITSMYDRLDYVNEDSILTKFLEKGTVQVYSEYTKKIYPFGLNLSQKKALENAFNHDVSIIEGPPGTGKTQTILNIISNAVLQNKSVAVVSNNNAAIKNVQQKLEEYNLGFLLALLGNVDNKLQFFDEISNKNKPLEFLRTREFDASTFQLEKTAEFYQNELYILYLKENRLAQLNGTLKKYETELTYFLRDNKNIQEVLGSFKHEKIKHSRDALKLRVKLEHYRRLNWIKKFLIRFNYKMKKVDTYNENLSKTLLALDLLYYRLRIEETKVEIKKIKKYLSSGGFEASKAKFQKVSMELLKRTLYDRYSKMQTMEYTYENYRLKFSDFINEYPVVLSTTYSLIPSANDGYIFDYLIIDEASQTDVLSSVLAMSCARNMIVVGDTKQLPQIENKNLENVNDELKQHYLITDEYDYFRNNILTSSMGVFESVPKVLLREHYRCHPDIINFCNQRFYDNQLIILTKSDARYAPLKLYKTVPGNHARKNPHGSGLYNQREVDEICRIIEGMSLKSVGVVSPYRYQANILREAVRHIKDGIEADTVHKFQGRAKDAIILSTVVNSLQNQKLIDEKYEDFVARSDLLNVAVSRARKQLILVVSDKIYKSKNNAIADLIKYIQYNSESTFIQEGKIQSIFDLLYDDYQDLLNQFRSKHYSKTVVTEQLTLKLITKILKNKGMSFLKVFMHYPLRLLVNDREGFTQREIQFVKHPSAHVDFVIMNTLTKEPVLVVEVDGISFHEQNFQQSDRDKIKDRVLSHNDITVLRLKTNESNEETRIKQMLDNVLLS